jgi:acyl-CoA thioesterase-1
MNLRNPFRSWLWSVCFLASALPVLAQAGTAADKVTASATVLILGDSISAAYGMSLEEGWVALLAAQLAQEQLPYEVVNASISGETSAGAAARLPSLLERHRPRVVVVELGGNDGLRGYPVKRLRENLRSMAELSQQANATVLFLGMQIPPNYGSRYTSAFRDSFALVAEQTNSALAPFMLEGIAGVPTLMQADGIHPTPQAQQQLLTNVWPYLRPLLQ